MNTPLYWHQERTQSETMKKYDRAVINPRYKTELCRHWEKNDNCKYGDKCQFAHGSQDRRILTCHPKYKTKRCRTFHTKGICPYGPRCHFIHNGTKANKRPLRTPQGNHRSRRKQETVDFQRARNRDIVFIGGEDSHGLFSPFMYSKNWSDLYSANR